MARQMPTIAARPGDVSTRPSEDQPAGKERIMAEIDYRRMLQRASSR